MGYLPETPMTSTPNLLSRLLDTDNAAQTDAVVRFTAALAIGDEPEARRALETRKKRFEKALLFAALKLVDSNPLAQTLAKELLARGTTCYLESDGNTNYRHTANGYADDPLTQALRSGDADLVVAMVSQGANMVFGRTRSIYHSISAGQFELSDEAAVRIAQAFLDRDPELALRVDLGDVRRAAVLEFLLDHINEVPRGDRLDALHGQAVRPDAQTDPRSIHLLLALEPVNPVDGAALCAAALRAGSWTGLRTLLDAGFDLPRAETISNWHGLARACMNCAQEGRQLNAPAWLVDVLGQDDPHLWGPGDMTPREFVQEKGGGGEFFAPVYAQWEARQLEGAIAPADGAPRPRM